jgi:hypothetical protein
MTTKGWIPSHTYMTVYIFPIQRLGHPLFLKQGTTRRSVS